MDGRLVGIRENGFAFRVEHKLEAAPFFAVGAFTVEAPVVYLADDREEG